MFVHPLLLLLLLFLPVLTGVKLLADARARRASGAVVAPRLRPYLLPGSRSAGNAGRWVSHALQILALALLVTALARPQWGFTESETQGEGRDILIALDTSRSMLADDLKP
ncbi:BatA domain-containing protein, partial [Verrucomicrobiales bacterium]|nr:BatA domain-containing protein [Verrucomicrobiales bacterium]